MGSADEALAWKAPGYVSPSPGELPKDCSRTLQVIGAGLPRTGTLSFATALGYILEGPVCHGGHACLRGPEHVIKRWIKVLNPSCNTTQEQLDYDLKNLVAGYVATTDAPTIFFVEEFCRLYPDSVVICPRRDGKKWFESYLALDYLGDPLYILMTLVQPTLRYVGFWKLAMTKRMHKIYPPGFAPMGPEFMEHHSDYLKRVVPPGRLFFYDIKDGWEPLCKILNKPIPDAEFPHLHERNYMAARKRLIMRRGALTWLGILASFAILYYAVHSAYRA